MGENKRKPDFADPQDVSAAEIDKAKLEMVRDALEADRVLLAFQPIVQAGHPNRPAYYEGLIRLCDVDGRIIQAGAFIDAVEGDEIGRLIDCAALQLGLQTLAMQPDIRLSINLSALSIGYKKWHRILYRGLRQDPTVGERLILEITERSAIEMPDAVLSFMNELQDMGIAFALDDFGAGFSAFRYLRDFHFDILKIDGQFIRGFATSRDNQVLVRALISIARHFDMLTVAEFVETEADAQLLTDYGIDCMQGYYFGLPTVRPIWTLKHDSAWVPA